MLVFFSPLETKVRVSRVLSHMEKGVMKTEGQVLRLKEDIVAEAKCGNSDEKS